MGYIKITVQSPKSETEIRNHNPPFIFISKKKKNNYELKITNLIEQNRFTKNLYFCIHKINNMKRIILAF